MAENIDAGYSSPGSAVDALVASPGHCRNLMDPALTQIGVGHSYNAAAAYDHDWTQDFGRPR